MKMKLTRLTSLLLCATVCAALIGCGDSSEERVPVKVETIGSNVEPADYISVLESMSGPDRKKYVEEHKAELDTVMAKATADDKAKLDSVMKLP